MILRFAICRLGDDHESLLGRWVMALWLFMAVALVALVVLLLTYWL